MAIKLLDGGVAPENKGAKLGAGMALLSRFAKAGRSGVLDFKIGKASLRLLAKKAVGFLYELAWTPKQYAASPTQNLGTALSNAIQLKTFTARFYQYGVVTWAVSEAGEFGPPVVHSYGPATPEEQMPARDLGVHAVTEDTILFSAAPPGWTGAQGTYSPYFFTYPFYPGPYYPHTDVSAGAQPTSVYTRPGTLSATGVTWQGTADVQLAYEADTCELEDTIMLYEKVPGDANHSAYGWHVALWTHHGRDHWERLFIPRPDYASDTLIHGDFAGVIGVRWSQEDTHSTDVLWAQFDYYTAAGALIYEGTPFSWGAYSDGSMTIGRFALTLVTTTVLSTPPTYTAVASATLYLCLPGGTSATALLSGVNVDNAVLTAGVSTYNRYGVEGGPKFTRLTVVASSDTGPEYYYNTFQISPLGGVVDYATSYAWFNGNIVPLQHQEAGTLLTTIYSSDGEAVVYGSSWPVTQYYIESSGGLSAALPVGVSVVDVLVASPDKQYVLFFGWGTHNSQTVFHNKLYRGGSAWAPLPVDSAARFSDDSTRLIAYSSGSATLWSLTQLTDLGLPTILAATEVGGPALSESSGAQPYVHQQVPEALLTALGGYAPGGVPRGGEFFDATRPPYVFPAFPVTSQSFPTLHYYPAVAEPASPARYVANLVAYELGILSPPA